MGETVVARGSGRLLSRSWKGPGSDCRSVEYSCDDAGEPVSLVLWLANLPAAHENKDGGRASGLGAGGGVSRRGFWPKVRKEPVFAPGGCWIWIGYLDKNGSGKFCTRRNGKQITLRAARAAWEEARGSLADGSVLFADCANSACVNPDHHRPIARIAVTREIHAAGRPVEYADNRGEMSGRAQLRNDDVLFIRSQPAAYGLVPVLARLFGVTRQLVRNVRYRKTWRHLGNGNKANAMPLAQLRALAEQREQRPPSIDDFATARPGEA